MKAPLVLALAAGLIAPAAPAIAQPYYQDYEYQRRLNDYEMQRREYERRWAEYEAARRDYDRRYGAGAYDRYYGRPADPYGPGYVDPRYPYDNRYDDRYGYDPRYPDSRYDTRYEDPYRYYSSSPCERRATSSNRDTNMFAGGVIGALAGAAIGANIADRDVREEGAVLGALAGAAIGASIAGSASSDIRYDRYAAKCDASGYYYTYDQTFEYRESRNDYGRRSGRYDVNYYQRQRCRLAIAPAYAGGRSDYRYVRVCPDRQNRYRITA